MLTELDHRLNRYRPLARWVAAAILRWIGRSSGIEIEDMEAVALAEVWKAIKKNSQASPSALIVQSRYACIDWLRKHGPVCRSGRRRYCTKQLSQLADDDPRRDPDYSAVTDRSVAMIDLADEASRLLDGLPLKHRTACRLYYLEQLTMREVAMRMGMSEPNVSLIIGQAKLLGRKLPS